ncbi:myosin-J heavy chain-like [Phoenix dactylifera]|uniref:Myosin-J heavy chain-like n=1 Tax=Phoenix dactylifera TaxID=42345 RepID=A0A8B8ZGT2_PHODC|nr:myosin-J heavy chain-like [Phoenix dactylifera]
MRRFFSLGSSISSTGNSNTTPAPRNKKKGANPAGEKVHDGSRNPKGSVLKSRNHYPQSEDSSNSHLRRSLSFSSPSTYSGLEEENLNFSSDINRLPSSYGNRLHDAGECPIHCHTLTPERYRRRKEGDQSVIQKSNEVEDFDSPGLKCDHCSSGNSSYSSIPLRSRATCLIDTSNKGNILDLYIDGEHQVVKPHKDYHKNSSDIGDDGSLQEKTAFPSSGRPPQAQSTAPSSPTCKKENLRSFSFREAKSIHHHHSARAWTADYLRLASLQGYTGRYGEKPSHAFPGKSLKSQDYDSETTTTIEDVYEDSSDAQPSLNLHDVPKAHSFELTSSSENTNDHCLDKIMGIQRNVSFPVNGPLGIQLGELMSSGLHEQDTDEELFMKLKEVEEKSMLLSEENLELEKLRDQNLSLTTLQQMIQNIREDRKYLALELSSQIKCRLAERFCAKEQLKKSRVDLDTRMRRLEKEKHELQSTLEKELDRRTNDWSLKLGKFQTEEQRLRERVRELAEQNVSLQREVCSLKANGEETQSRIMNSEMHLRDLTACLEEAKTENHSLHESLSKLQDCFNGVEEDRDNLQRSYKEKEKENKELQKVVVKLQRICSEQEKSISGLRQGYSDEIGKTSMEGSGSVSRLQMEQLRLTGVEQMLRREIESCRLELECLRHENMSLLDRLQGTGSGYGFLTGKLDQPLHARVECLQTQGLSLLDDNSQLCGVLLEYIKRKQYEHNQEASSDLGGYAILEHTLKHQSLKRGIDNFRRSLQTTLAILNEKSSIEALEQQLQTTKDCRLRQLKVQESEGDMELKLRTEAMLTRVLREKLCSRELEFEQVQADLASSIRARDILQTEIQRQQDELSCLTHKMKNMEHQIVKKDEIINQLQQNLQDPMKELAILQGILTKVSEERDQKREEVKQLRKSNMLINDEVKTLRKKVETLNEDILLKEGQLSILKNSLDRPFDIINSFNLRKEFSLE